MKCFESCVPTFFNFFSVEAILIWSICLYFKKKQKGVVAVWKQFLLEITELIQHKLGLLFLVLERQRSISHLF